MELVLGMLIGLALLCFITMMLIIAFGGMIEGRRPPEQQGRPDQGRRN